MSRLLLLNDKKNKLKFPLPVVNCSFNACRTCHYCCQWCDYVTDTGCSAPDTYEMLSLCNAFPILIGHGESRNPSLGLWNDQFPAEFGAFVPLGRECLATMDERQRVLFQKAANFINNGLTDFTLFEQCLDYFIHIRVFSNPFHAKKHFKILKTPTQIVNLLSANNI
ncbi:MAG: hypothetical protein ACXAC7_02995 [Candidatus Hodarchaeales archaeon]